MISMVNSKHSASTSKIPGVFRNRNFRMHFSARIISQTGDQIYVFAISWYILDATQSSLQMTVPLILTTVITAFVSLFGGTIADRLNRKDIIIRTDILQGFVLLMISILLYQNWLQIWMLYLFTIVLALCSAVFSPAASAIITDIVQKDQLMEATSANQFTISFCTVVGMLTGGFLYNLCGIVAILLFNAASNFTSAFLESHLDFPMEKQKKYDISLSNNMKQSVHELSEGYGYVKRHTPLFHLLLVNSLFNFIALPIGLVYIPYYFNVILHSTSAQLAIPQAAVWFGMILATLIIPFSLRKTKLPKLIWRGLIWMSICTLAGIPLMLSEVIGFFSLGQITMIWVAINLYCGITVNLFTVPLYTLFQKNISNEYRGRFWGIENSIRTIALCSGYLLAGLLAQKVWLGFLFAGAALIMFIMAIWVRNLNSIKKLD